MNAPVIKPNPTRSAGSTAVLEFLARIHPLTARQDELRYVFADVDTRATATSPWVKRFDAALRNMTQTGTLICAVEGADRQWSLGPLVLQEPAKADAPKAQAKKDLPASEAEPEPDWIGTRAPAPRRDMLHSSEYKPTPWNVPRSGAQDFKAAPSVGTRC